MKRFVIADIHGRLEALKQVLEDSYFDYEKDKLIVLGDIVDGGYNTAQVVDELLKITHLVFILGNHDDWFMKHMSNGWAEEIWLQQGGANTLKSYGAEVKESEFISEQSYVNTEDMNVPVTHQDFFNNSLLYYEEDDMLFVHGGINPNKHILEQKRLTLLWDRDLIHHFRVGKSVPEYKKIFIGHTTTQHIGTGSEEPIIIKNKHTSLYCMDCGAGWNGKLALLDIDTDEYWLSDKQKPAIGDKK